MHRTWVIGFWGVVVLAGGSLLAQETLREDAAEKGVAVENGVPEPGGTVIRSSSNSAAATHPTTGEPANRWRYRFHNGHWWYYGRANEWSYWNGSTWTPYDRETYGQWFNRQFRRYGSDARSDDTPGLDRRPAGTIQREKNDARSPSLGPVDRRPSGAIQREKNDPRAQDVGSGRRRAGTIQREKNSPRGEEEE
ncbi:MAG TPA: hypothetical protein VG826_29775 [Pirellulales bacterium]|nr:hypothetical protein [Pirellulales bacterium]